MSVRRQVLCQQCGASHHIRRQLRPDVVYRFFCKACGAFVLFDRSQVRWATSERALRPTRTRPEEPHDAAHDTVIDRRRDEGRKIWQATTLAPSDDLRATLDGVQGIWRQAEPASPRPARPAPRTLPAPAPEPSAIEVHDEDIVDATDVSHAASDVDDTLDDAAITSDAAANDGQTTIADQRPPLHVTPLLRPRIEAAPVESSRVRWLRHMLRRGAA